MALVNMNYVTQTRFAVSVPDIGLEQQVTKVSGLKMELKVLEVSTGENFNVLHRPGNSVAQEVSLEMPMHDEHPFLNWYIQFAEGVETTHDVKIDIYGRDGSTIIRSYVLQHSWVKTIELPELDGAGSNIAICKAVLVYDNLIPG